MSIRIFLFLSNCWFIELDSFLAWLIRSVMFIVSLSSGVKKDLKYLNLRQKDIKRSPSISMSFISASDDIPILAFLVTIFSNHLLSLVLAFQIHGIDILHVHTLTVAKARRSDGLKRAPHEDCCHVIRMNQ
jgi:hypothetical protein